MHNLSAAPCEVTVDVGPMDGFDTVVDLLDGERQVQDVDGSALTLKLAGYAHHWFGLARADGGR